VAAPYSNLRSKLNRAVAAYLIGAGVGPAASIKPANVRTPKVFTDSVNTTVRARLGKPDIKFSGNYNILLHLIIRGSAMTSNEQPGDEDARQLFDARIAAVYDAMMQSDNGTGLEWAANAITDAGRALATTDIWDDAPASAHADMADFTMLDLQDGGFGDANPNEQEHIWEEILVFECVVCGSVVPGYSNL
jgi:hypothetical protein